MVRLESLKAMLNTLLSILLLMIPSVLWASPVALAGDEKYPLEFYTEVYPPTAYYENEQLTGYAVEAIQLIWDAIGQQKQTINVVPWARGYRQLQIDAHTVLFPMSRSKQREQQFKWAGPMLSQDYVLVSKKSIPSERTLAKNLYKNSFAIIRDDVTEEMLKAQGVKSIIESTDMDDAEKMLANGRIEILAIALDGLKDIYKVDSTKQQQYQVIATLGTTYDYIAFNKQVPDKVINQYQSAIILLNSKLNKLKEKYGLAINQVQ